ncbi:hypothetical protein ACT3QR_04145 [Psychrobacter sp. AOP7-B1-25]|uniref:hypothetical protein n=1 Tax=Psychrobacter sp. AOP7-B1-25 TaxID=3457644 RepID=UPI00402B9A36
MKKLLFILLASTVGVAACASSGTSDHNHKRPAMSANMKQAMNDCAKKSGVKMNKDSRPSKNDMKKIDSCMSAKGFEKPAGQGRH